MEKKLYIWEGVLQDYSCGMIACWATSLEEARELFHEKCSHADMNDLYKIKPIICSQKSECQAFYVWGGG